MGGNVTRRPSSCLVVPTHPPQAKGHPFAGANKRHAEGITALPKAVFQAFPVAYLTSPPRVQAQPLVTRNEPLSTLTQQPREARGYSPVTPQKPYEPQMCYTDCAFHKKNAGIAGKDSAATSRVWPETAIRLTHRTPSRRKPRWLLWLEGPSSDRSRRAAAALRIPRAMLTR
jgi:hypothetical protein